MKNLLTLTFLLIGLTSYSQSISLEDWNNDGILECVKYSDNGYKLEEGYILSGKYHGKWTTYDDYGNIKVIANFNNGKRDGLWKFYNDSGKVTHKVTYVDNRRTSASITRYFE